MSVRLLFLTKRYVLFSAIHWCLRFFLTSVFHPYFPHPLQDLCDWVQPTLKASRDWLINQSPCIINNNLILFIDRPVSRGVDTLEHCLSFALSVSLVMCFMFCPPEVALSLRLCPPRHDADLMVHLIRLGAALQGQDGGALRIQQVLHGVERGEERRLWSH